MLTRTVVLARGLAVLFAVQTVGFVGLVWRQGTALGGSLFSSGLLTDAEATRVDRLGAASVVVAAFLLVVAPRRVAAWAGGWAAIWMAVITGADALRGGHFGAELAPAAHAVRWGVPAIVAALMAGASERSAVRGLAWAAAAVFAAHGLECMWGHPTFVDFLVAVPLKLTGLTVDGGEARRLLTVIGVVDILVATMLVTVMPVAVALWMAGWGVLTAVVRVLYFGEAGWPDALVRVTNGGVPLAIAVMLASRRWRSK